MRTNHFTCYHHKITVYFKHLVSSMATGKENVENIFVIFDDDDTDCVATDDVKEKEERNIWSEDQTLSLIEEYKRLEHKFKSSTVRNFTCWQEIARNLEHHTALQCENRFKYLKNQYIKKVESLGPKNTGGTFIKFAYFDKFEEIFGQKPNIRPIALASSSKRDSSILEHRKYEEDSSSSEEVAVKRKKTKLEKHLEEMDKKSDLRESARERRHKDNMEQRREALNIFSTFCNSVTELLRKGDE